MDTLNFYDRYYQLLSIQRIRRRKLEADEIFKESYQTIRVACDYEYDQNKGSVVINGSREDIIEYLISLEKFWLEDEVKVLPLNINEDDWVDKSSPYIKL